MKKNVGERWPWHQILAGLLLQREFGKEDRCLE